MRAGVSALGRTWAAAHLHWRALAAARSRRPYDSCPVEHHLAELLRIERPFVRYLIYGGAGLAVALLLATGLLWWRLSTGPLSVDVATPWLTSAIEERLGGGHRIEVGGTQLERDEDGRTALRLRDIIMRDRTGSIVANAPKAEVGLSGAGLLTGSLRATRLSLIGATMSVRIEPDGHVNVSAGGEQNPITAASVATPLAQAGIITGTARPAGADAQAGESTLSSLLSWLDGLDALGFDGRDLTEVGLKNGALVVDDRRSGKHWNFQNINFSLTRPQEGGVAFAVTSTGTDGPWSMTATVAPRGEGRRSVEAVIRDVSPKDILLALRVDDDTLDADIPISALVRAEVAADGTVHMAEGRIIAGAGFVGSGNAPATRMLIDEAQVQLRWDAANRVLHLPFELNSGGNRVSFVARLHAPPQPGEPWRLGVNRGMVLLGAGERTREPPLVLDRVVLQARIDPVKRQFIIDQGELSGMATGVAFSAALDYADEARLTMGMAATRMTVLTLKRLWPVFIVPPLRAWVIAHFTTGMVERLEIATNAPWHTLKPGGPPVPDDGLSGEIVGTASLRPVDTLPAIRDADIVARFTGRTATVTLGRGTVELPSGRRIAVSNGTFEVADTALKPPTARARLRLDGPAEAAIELAGMEPLRGAAGIQLDAATTRGTITSQLSLSLPLKDNLRKGDVAYNFDAEVTNFSAEKLVRGLKAEAPVLRVNASPEGFRVNGDARIGNAVVAVDYRKRPDGDAEARAQTVLDDAARSYLGFELGGALTGPIPIKFSGKIAAHGDNRFAVDADLSQAKVSDLLPGWNKGAGKPARATFILLEKAHSRRIEDLLLEGSGARVKGTIEVDAAGELVAANFPTFALSDGDKSTVKAERGADGTLKVTVRGDVYDGRGLIKSIATGPADPNAPRRSYDLDLDVKLGAVAGFHGEALRGLEVRLARRAGQIRSFAMSARIGLEAQLSGDLRARNGRQVIHIESGDAGALFRLTDLYPRVQGGRMWVAMEPPNADPAPKEGTLSISEFSVRGESALDRVASSAPPPDSAYRAGPARNHGVEFSRMRVEFSRSPGRLSIREGNVWGVSVCATMGGQIDFLREDVRLRGTFIPACALNNMPTQIPVLGYFLGGPKEGLLGVTYEVVGPPNGMVLRVNPVSVVAPGFLRKLFEFRHGDDNLVTGETR